MSTASIAVPARVQATDAAAGAAAEFPASQIWPIKGQLLIGLVSLGVGGLIGLMQAVERVGVDLYQTPIAANYYQGLTLHGVLLALVFTFTFATSFLTLTTMKGFERPMASTLLVQATFWFGFAGVLLAGYAMLTNQANVLYTFYAPMQGHVAFYLGAALLVVSTWCVSLNQILTWLGWRKANPGQRIPLLAFVSIVSFLMWDLASVGIAVETLTMLIPWSAGLRETINPQVTRTLFWYTGHAIVYFWLMPAYVSWYMMIPKQVGGKLYSDGLTRFTFLIFLLYSVPTGLHHQFTDPGIPVWMKTVHFFTTIVIALPSLITAFSLMAALEHGGRAKGGGGILGWIPKLNWGSPSVANQLLAMLTFVLGGITGIINSSYTVNSVVHNTAFIVGHFHITVGTAVAQTIMGVCYWLVPYLTGRALWGRRLGVLQAWLYTIGVLVFARGQMWGGIDGMPRRTALGEAPYAPPEWLLSNQLTALGGLLMAIAGVLFLLCMIVTVVRREPAHVEIPVSEAMIGADESWGGFDNLRNWTLLGVLLIVLAYGPTFVYLAGNEGVARGIPMPAMGFVPTVPGWIGGALVLGYIALVVIAFVSFWRLLQSQVRRG